MKREARTGRTAHRVTGLQTHQKGPRRAEGEDYETKIKSLKKQYADSDPTLFDILAHIKDMTSDKIHEQSWDKWDSKYLKLIIETLRTILHDIYVLPQVKAERSKFIEQLRKDILTDKKEKKASKTKEDGKPMRIRLDSKEE